MTDSLESKKSSIKEKIQKIARAFLIGAIESGIAAAVVFLLALANDWATFGVFIIWLFFGWFSASFIKVNTLEILITMLSILLVSFVIFFFGGISLWFIPILIGLSLLFWVVSFISRIFLYPIEKKSENESYHEN